MIDLGNIERAAERSTEALLEKARLRGGSSGQRIWRSIQGRVARCVIKTAVGTVDVKPAAASTE
jgi:hypothetical protein